MVRLLLEKGPDIEVKNNDRETALHLAACFGYEAVVQLLLEERAYDAAQGSLVWARGGDAAAEHGYQISMIMQTSPLTLSRFHALCVAIVSCVTLIEKSPIAPNAARSLSSTTSIS
jgi:ankyrin repeat protein